MGRAQLLTTALLLLSCCRESTQFTMDIVERKFDVKACWSKAGIGTCIIVEQRDVGSKGFHAVFDLGCTPVFDQTIKCDTVILSHGHVDHFGGIFSHARAHRLQYQGSVPKYYVPGHLVPKLQAARQIFSDIDATCIHDGSPNNRDESQIEMDIVSVKAGFEIELKQTKVRNGVRFYLRPFNVSHGGHPALGYTIVSKTTKRKLKKEFQGMDGKELGNLARNGVEIKNTEIVEIPEVCYTGDTSIDGLLRKNCCASDLNDFEVSSMKHLEQGFTAPLILSELTFLDPQDTTLARKRGHLNVKDIELILESHGLNPLSKSTGERQLVFYHISSKHAPAERVLDAMVRELPKEVLEIADVAIASFTPFKTDLKVKSNGCISLKDYASNSN